MSRFSRNGANGLESKTTHMFRPVRQVAAPADEVCRLRLRIVATYDVLCALR